MPKRAKLEFDKVFAQEKMRISARRELLAKQDQSSKLKEKGQAAKPKAQEPGLFGIALSGGGIRSATLNLGILKVLNDCGILRKADYLSTVSGGGFIGAHVQAQLRKYGRFESLFEEPDIEELRRSGYYLAPGIKFAGFMHKVRMFGAFVASFAMNLVWIALLFLSLIAIMRLIPSPVEKESFTVMLYLAVPVGIILVYHYFFHFLRDYFQRFKLWSSDVLNYFEGVLLGLGLIVVVVLASHSFPSIKYGPYYETLLLLGAFLVTGFFGNPNILTMHRFYRDRLASAFMQSSGEGSGSLKLHELFDAEENPAPYPLINCCLNVLERSKEDRHGSKLSDFFLLSPLYCGSLLTGYLRTSDRLFRKLTLPTAVAASGAAVNPVMGSKTNRVVSFFLSLMNLQLGYWAPNPHPEANAVRTITWWPYYLIMQMLAKTGITRKRVNLSDGGHIENLAVYELLRRKCDLIVAVDAGADPEYSFSDLQNLVMRARSELGLIITFRTGCEPETVIRPSPSTGFSKSHFAIADIKQMDGTNEKDSYSGLLVYVKASMKAQNTWKNFKDIKGEDNLGGYIYKTHHPRFPQESTAEQFFDKDQWNAYYYLGQFIAWDLFGITVKDPSIVPEEAQKKELQSIPGLITYFSALQGDVKTPKKGKKRGTKLIGVRA